ncbi:sigma-70 family RNA polymerase sigma factor [Nakamurella endophytica]|uniref:RNA polymerase sigma factor SigK n=1 Tax=Nakamurella endophytica TaxID=1748367 RepID=A0A917WG48_9ACTN|nr:sigma-70 family RNA polymerase sigma factor [Nakamurella endophytica]GGM01085.1 RNA polymerase sigma factor SigK [Nakamurella endophytica]
MTSADRSATVVLDRADAASGLGGRTPEQLLGLIAQSDHRAFDELYARFGSSVRRTALAVLRDPSHAEEVAQEVFLHIWRNAADFAAGRGSAVSWIGMLTHSRAVDRVRSTAAARRRDRVDAETGYAREHDSVAEQVLLRHEHAQVRAGLAGLTTLQRQSIELMYFGQLSHEQIGLRLSVPPATVKTRIRDGLVRLRTVVGQSTS